MECAHDDRPAANPPISDDSAHDVRVGTRELLGHCGGVGSENEHGTVGGIGERTSEEQLVPFGRGPRKLEMLSTELAPPFDVIVDDVVQQQPIHRANVYRTALALAQLS